MPSRRGTLYTVIPFNDMSRGTRAFIEFSLMAVLIGSLSFAIGHLILTHWRWKSIFALTQDEADKVDAERKLADARGPHRARGRGLSAWLRHDREGRLLTGPGASSSESQSAVATSPPSDISAECGGALAVAPRNNILLSECI